MSINEWGQKAQQLAPNQPTTTIGAWKVMTTEEYQRFMAGNPYPIFPESEPGKKPETIRSSILTEANGIVNGARANVYGGPEDSFRTIAGLWSVYLKTEHPLDPADVAAMLALMKIARIQQSPNHRDSWVDIAGYAACGAECGLK